MLGVNTSKMQSCLVPKFIVILDWKDGYDKHNLSYDSILDKRKREYKTNFRKLMYFVYGKKMISRVATFNFHLFPYITGKFWG